MYMNIQPTSYCGTLFNIVFFIYVLTIVYLFFSHKLLVYPYMHFLHWYLGIIYTCIVYIECIIVGSVFQVFPGTIDNQQLCVGRLIIIGIHLQGQKRYTM